MTWLTAWNDLREVKRIRFAIMRAYSMSAAQARRTPLHEVGLMLEHLQPQRSTRSETPLEASIVGEWEQSEARGEAALEEAETEMAG